MKRFFTAVGVFASVVFGFIVLLSFIGISKLGSHTSAKLQKESILALDLEGVIIDAKVILENLRQYRKDPNIKGVLVKINSPGGVVGPSQELYTELKRVRDEWQKPVVVSLNGVAASGAFYAAVAADKIVTNPGTMVGSIGVIMEFANLQGLYEWAKIQRFTITTGPYKDSGAEYRPMRVDEKELFQGLINDVLSQFINHVAEGRKLDPAEVRKYADGRVFTGSFAVEHKFADQLGSYDDAIKLIGEMTGLGQEPNLFVPPKKRPDIFELLGDAEARFSITQQVRKTIHSSLVGVPLAVFPGALLGSQP